MNTQLRLFYATALCFVVLSLSAQVELLPSHFQFDTHLSYNKNIPSPDSHLGYELGEAFTVYAQVVEYFKKLADSSPKITLHQYGKTYEGRPLYNVVITSEANQNQIEDIRQNNLKLVNQQQELDGKAIEEITDQLPVFVSYSYSIHGNEASSTEAVMQVAYRLVAAEDAATQNILDNAVLIFYICINPDGRDRYVYWYNGMQRSKNGIEPKDIEHYAPFPNGRTNHYWFDLNRDWIWGIHPESRGHTAEYQKWMPHLHTDYHEMGYNSNYFTMPGTTPRNKLLPDNYEPLSDTIGRANGAAFDRHQINYFTREAFDFYYPSYGSSYPSVMGAIGMLVEQGGIGAGLAIKTNDDYVLTLRQRIFDHYLTSMATIEKAVERKKEFIRYSLDAWNPAKSKSSTKTYIFPAENSVYLPDLINILLHHNVKVERADESFSVRAAKNYRTGQNYNGNFQKGAYIVSANQSRHLFIHSLLERNMIIEDSVMYDMATWSAPLAYNLETFSSEQSLKIATSPLTTPIEIASGIRDAEQATYAYLVEWKQRNAPKALAMLWEKGYRVRAARKAFETNKRAYSAGSLIVLLGRNRAKLENIQKDMDELAAAAKVVIDGAASARSVKGIDLASNEARPLKQPKVALLVEPPFSTYTSGQIYFLFDQETRLPVERIRTSILEQTALPKFGSRYGYANLNDYDVLILPGASVKNLKQLFKKEQIEELKSWLKNGGVLVATEESAIFFTQEKSKFSDIKLLEVKKDSSDVAIYLNFEDRRDFEGKKRIPGTALNALIDHTHPLAFGLNQQLYSLKYGSFALQADPNLQTVGHYHKNEKQLWVAGYASKENLKHLAGNVFAAVLPMGKGKLVFLLDNTQYRMFWRGPSRMMQNAVMLLPGM